jgi:hypothetical protein
MMDQIINMESLQTLLTIASVIFASGILYGKIRDIERKVDKIEALGDRITKIEVELENIKEKLT